MKIEKLKCKELWSAGIVGSTDKPLAYDYGDKQVIAEKLNEVIDYLNSQKGDFEDHPKMEKFKEELFFGRRTLKCGCSGKIGFDICECDLPSGVNEVNSEKGNPQCPSCPAQKKIKEEEHNICIHGISINNNCTQCYGLSAKISKEDNWTWLKDAVKDDFIFKRETAEKILRDVKILQQKILEDIKKEECCHSAEEMKIIVKKIMEKRFGF